jgi:glycosyltransferase involved in cell wall biosynthesis
MAKTSVIIPSRNELFLPQTVSDLLAKAAGEIEVIVVLDGYWPDPPLPDHDNLIIIHRGKTQGMRAAINSAAAIAKGEWLMKCDAHCMFAEGFDEVLKADCDKDWVVIPRRYSLDAENWQIEQNGKLPRDYHYLCFPDPAKGEDMGMHGVEWWDRCKKRTDPQYDIDDEMSSQGSCWWMTKYHFDHFLHGLSEEGYGTFCQEFQQIGNSTWLGGGRVAINKKTFYAHLHKGKKYGRMYNQSRSELIPRINWSARYWMNNEWKERQHDFSWLIEKFWPVPGWPEDRSLWVAP